MWLKKNILTDIPLYIFQKKFILSAIFNKDPKGHYTSQSLRAIHTADILPWNNKVVSISFQFHIDKYTKLFYSISLKICCAYHHMMRLKL